jgi:carboxylate-amine ligase
MIGPGAGELLLTPRAPHCQEGPCSNHHCVETLSAHDPHNPAQHAHPRDGADRLRAVFSHDVPGTIGVEEEVMLLDGATFDLRPDGPAVLAADGPDVRFVTELPAAQLEIVLPPLRSVADVADALRDARRDLAARAAPSGAVLAGGGVHPFAAGVGALNDGPRYRAIAGELAGVARRQLVFGLHVHVALAGPDAALAVYNAIREELPALAALAANAPYYEGADSGLASVRPALNDLLPRHGIPPALESWEAVAALHAWGKRTGAVPDAGQWWWEARLHPVHGTLEVRACDTQATVTDTAALVAVVHGLAGLLAARHAAGELPAPAPAWRIAENRWSASRHGVRGRWFDVRDGATRAMDDHLHALLDDLTPFVPADRLADARDLVAHPRAERVRALLEAHGPRAAMGRMAGEFSG